MNAALTPLRERYTELMANPRGIIDILEEGSARARLLAAEKIRMLRGVIGMD